MAIDITNLGRVNKYFKSVYGFVPNKYYITIGKSLSGGDILSFYAKTVSLPQIKINTVNDIYVSASSLAKPKLPISAESVGEISITFTEDDRLAIYNKLIGYHSGIVGPNYEATSNFENIIITISIYNNSKVVFNKTYNKCSLFDLVPLKVDYSSRKFLEYEATFTCNDISNSLTYDDPNYVLNGSNSSGVVSCVELQKNYQEGVRKFKTYLIDERYINATSPKSTLNGQIGADRLGLPVMTTFGNGETTDENSKYNADIQVEYFLRYVKPAIVSLKNNKCNIPPFPAIQGTFPLEDVYVKTSLRSEGFGV